MEIDSDSKVLISKLRATLEENQDLKKQLADLQSQVLELQKMDDTNQKLIRDRDRGTR